MKRNTERLVGKRIKFECPHCGGEIVHKLIVEQEEPREPNEKPRQRRQEYFAITAELCLKR